jgi:hypothetical protein
VVADPNNDSYLDGCRVAVVGLDAALMNRALRLLHAGGATRYRDLRPNATHVVAPSYEHVQSRLLAPQKVQHVHCCVVSMDWLVDCYRNKALMPSADYALVKYYRCFTASHIIAC